MDEFDLLVPENPPQPRRRRDAEVQLTIRPRDERPHESMHPHPAVLAIAAPLERSARNKRDVVSACLEAFGKTDGRNERPRDDVADSVADDRNAAGSPN